VKNWFRNLLFQMGHNLCGYTEESADHDEWIKEAIGCYTVGLCTLNQVDP
jgi:hypothetical protein